MQITYTIPVTFTVHLDTTQAEADQLNDKWLAEDAAKATRDLLHNDELMNQVVEVVTDATGWLVRGMSMTTG